jgi:(2Fe-2S) ferredoxin
MPRRYLLVCRGPNCKAQGSEDLRERLRAAIAAGREASTTEPDVVVLAYTCFDRCGRGPNAVVYPDGVWYEALTTDDVEDVARHALGGKPASDLVAAVDASHAEECYRILDETIPELEADEQQRATPRRRSWWPF